MGRFAQDRTKGIVRRVSYIRNSLRLTLEANREVRTGSKDLVATNGLWLESGLVAGAVDVAGFDADFDFDFGIVSTCLSRLIPAFLVKQESLESAFCAGKEWWVVRRCSSEAEVAEEKLIGEIVGIR